MDWGGANSRFLGLVSVGAENDIKTVCHKKNPSNDIKYITHMQRVLGGKREMYTKEKRKEETL